MAVPSFNIAPGESSDAAAARRKMAMALMMQGMDTSPVQHWTQGAARVAQSLMGGYELYKDDQKTEKEKSEARDTYSKVIPLLFGQGGTQASGAVPSQGTVTVAPKPQAAISPELLTSPQSAPQKDIYEKGDQIPLDPVPGAMTPNMRRLAAAIYPGESGGRPNVMYTPPGSPTRTFSDFSQHPNSPARIPNGPHAGDVSTAAGLGQITKPTWDRAQQALGLPDFSPGNQNAATAYIANEDYKKRTGRDLEADLTQAGNDPAKLNAIAKVLAPTWTSLPGGIEQNAAGAKFAQNAASPVMSDAVSSQSVRPQPAQQQQPGGMNAIAPMLPGMLNNQYTAPLAQGLVNAQIQNQLSPKDTPDILNYQYAVRNGFKGSPIEWKAAQEAAVERAKSQAQKEGERAATQPDRDKIEKQTAGIVVEDIDRAIGAIDKNPRYTTGPIGAYTKGIPGTPAHQVSKYLDTVKANTSLDKLQQMRQASPTGGALGSVTEGEHKLLQAAIGSVEQSQDVNELKFNLNRVKQIYSEIINGKGGGATPKANAPRGGAGGTTSSGLKWSVD